MATTSPATPISRKCRWLGRSSCSKCFDQYLNAFGSPEEKRERFKQTDPDSVWLVGHPDYPLSHGPTLTFTDSLTLNVGNHTFNIIHMPGHTAPQTSVYVPEEGVVFTGDNVFHKCRTWMQECDPWEWLAALDQIAALDVETIVPGHGEPCGKDYLREQAQIVENWVGFIETHVDRGVEPDEILKGPIPVTRAGPVPDRPAPVHPRRAPDRADRAQPAPPHPRAQGGGRHGLI